MLKTRVSVPSWCTVAHYATTLTGCDDMDDGFAGDCLTDTQTPWQGFTCGGRLIFKGAFNVFSGCVDVPQLLPGEELAPHSNQQLPNVELNAGPRASLSIMPRGWYRKNLIGARMHTIDMYRYCNITNQFAIGYADCTPDSSMVFFIILQHRKGMPPSQITFEYLTKCFPCRKKSMLVCQMLDARIFRFREHFPDMPICKIERRGGVDFVSEEDQEAVHDDVCPTPRVLLGFLGQWRDELDAHAAALELPVAQT